MKRSDVIAACAAALAWWHVNPRNFHRTEPAWLEQMRAIPGVREAAMELLRMNEDERDIEIARRRLREIKDDPSSLIAGDELKARLADLQGAAG